MRNNHGGTVLVILIVLGVLLIIGLALALWCVGQYNSLIRQDQEVKAAWAQVENQLQRRLDLIPNLVETVKGFAKQEQAIFVGVAEARSRVGGASNIPDKIKANNELTSALSRLMVVMEAYPQIKSDQNFLSLQNQLEGTENRVAVERMRYNETVKVFNMKIKSFPVVLFAGLMGFVPATFFEAPPEAKVAPKVAF